MRKYTNTTCLKDPIYAIFLKSWWFKDINYDHHIIISIVRSVPSFLWRRLHSLLQNGEDFLFFFSSLSGITSINGSLYKLKTNNGSNEYCCQNRNMTPPWWYKTGTTNYFEDIGNWKSSPPLSLSMEYVQLEQIFHCGTWVVECLECFHFWTPCPSCSFKDCNNSHVSLINVNLFQQISEIPF